MKPDTKGHVISNAGFEGPYVPTCEGSFSDDYLAPFPQLVLLERGEPLTLASNGFDPLRNLRELGRVIRLATRTCFVLFSNPNQ
jgi:hypothetical protein